MEAGSENFPEPSRRLDVENVRFPLTLALTLSSVSILNGRSAVSFDHNLAHAASAQGFVIVSSLNRASPKKDQGYVRDVDGRCAQNGGM